MAPKKDSAPAASSSKANLKGPPFISGDGVNDFAVAYDDLVERFAGGRADFSLCKEPIRFLNNACVLGPRYLENKPN